MSPTLALAILPALGLLALFQRWDRKRPEPKGAVRNVVILGMLSCIPAAIIELVLTEVMGEAVVHAQAGLVNGFVVAATTEETLKLAIILAFVWRKPHFNEVMDGILYTAAASLGFALLENVLYSANNLITGFLRAFTAVPLHAVCSGVMGYFVGRAKVGKGSPFLMVPFGLFMAISIHGLYDWAVFSGGTFGFGPPDQLLAIAEAVGIVLVFGVILYALVRHARALDDAMLGAVPSYGNIAGMAGFYGHGAPQYAYAAQGHPSQGYGGYPHTGHGAPQPHGGYPHQGWTSHAQQQPYTQQGYPQQGYPQPQHGAPQQGYAPQPGYAPHQGQPPRHGYPQQGAPHGPPAAPYPVQQGYGTGGVPGYGQATGAVGSWPRYGSGGPTK